MKIFKTLIFQIFIHLCFQNCNEFCLKCSSTNQCLFCDFTQNYFLQGFTCSKKTIENCQKQNLNGECIQCKSDYFLDSLTKKCVSFLETEKLINCQLYSSKTICIQCNYGFYQKNGKCQVIPAAIENCLTYQNEDSTICQQCKNGYILSFVRKSCLSPPINENCQTFSIYSCQKCKKGFILNQNNYLEKLEQIEELENFLQIFTIKEKQSRYNKQCIQQQIQNCEESEDLTTCKKCKYNYFLNSSNKCDKIPTQPIQNCEIYQNSITCLNCKQKFALINSSKCEKILEIENCQNYETNKTNPICLKCIDGYFLQGQICQLRNMNIENCKIYQKDKDQCQICGEGYQITNDFLLCLVNIENCSIHDPSISSLTPINKCVQCSNGFYLQNSLCVQGTIENCLKYKISENLCLECQNEFFLQIDTCRKHNQIENCLNYSKTKLNSCQQCNNYFLLFQVSSVCVQTSGIENCEKYQTETTCEICLKGFIISSDQLSCVTFPDENCTKQISNICTQCRENFYLWNITKKCINELTYKKFCLDIQFTNSNISCEICNYQSYLIPVQKFNVCIQNNITYLPEQKINNCIVYSFENGVLLCKECSANFYLDLNNKICLQNCNLTIILISIIFNNSKNTTLSQNINICTDIGQNQCKFAIQSNELNQEDFICIQCKQNIIPFYSLESNSLGKTHIVEIKDSFNSFSELNTFHSLQCEILQNHFFNLETNQTEIQNCSFYKKKIVNGKNGYFCVQCKRGYTGITNNDFIISCDIQITDCDTQSNFKGLLLNTQIDQQINKEYFSFFASCVKCINNKTPVLFMRKNQTFIYSPFSLQNEIPYNTLQTPQGIAMKCLSLQPTQFSLTSESIFNSIPVNCGFIFYDIGFQKSGDINGGASITCVACKPGFIPIYSSQKIIQCEQILNCNQASVLNVYFNKCGSCVINYVWDWQEEKMSYDFTKCVASLESFCKSFDSINQKCKSCEKGYYLNKDYKCEQILSPICKTTSSNFSEMNFSINLPRLNVNIYKAINSEGCQSCEGEFILFKISEQICFESSYLKSNTFPLTSQFIEKCLNYFLVNDELKCKKCIGNFIPSFDFKKCHTMTYELQGCILANSSTACNKCLSEKVLFNGKCTSPQISNCEIYMENSSIQSCQKCQKRFYLLENQCILGKIVNCELYFSQFSCQKCEDGNQLVQILGNSNYCFPITPNLNCIQFQETFGVMNLDCKICKPGFVLKQNLENQNKSQCVGHLLIKNCLQYDFTTNFQNSNLQCIFCETNFYVKDNQCITRINLDTHCSQFQKKSDHCQICQEGYFLSTDAKDCISFPNGIFGCEIYQDLQTCKKCIKNFYFEENLCVQKNSNELIENCEYYSNSITCVQCKLNYVIVVDQCIQTKAKNCLIAKDENSCESCPKGFGFKDEEGLKNCVQKSDANCLDFEMNFPFKCIICSINYFPNNEGICELVKIQINNCEIYDSSTTCSKCSNNRLLSQDKQKCLFNSYLNSIIDKNCENLKENIEMQCDECKPGFYFSNNECKNCESQTFESGCFICDYKDNKKCLYCRPSYYMNQQGQCVTTISLEPLKNKEKIFNIFLILFLIN